MSEQVNHVDILICFAIKELLQVKHVDISILCQRKELSVRKASSLEEIPTSQVRLFYPKWILMMD